MKDIQEYLSIRNSFTLLEAALLLTKKDPGVWRDKKLLNKPPPGFKAIYGRLLEDAVDVVDEAAESEEYPGKYYIEYALHTDMLGNLKKLSYKDGFSVMVLDSDLKGWLRARRRLQTIKKGQEWVKTKEDETSLFDEITLFKLVDVESIEASHFGSEETESPTHTKPPGHLNHDPEMQKKANEIAAEIIAITGRVPTKEKVAKELAPKLGITFETTLRRIRPDWKKKPPPKYKTPHK